MGSTVPSPQKKKRIKLISNSIFCLQLFAIDLNILMEIPQNNKNSSRIKFQLDH